MVVALLAVPAVQADPLMIGTVAPTFTLLDMAGAEQEVNFDKKVNVISFWVSSCSLCKEELRILNELSEKYKGKDLNITLVSTDFGGARIVKAVMKQTQTEAKVPILFDKALKVARDQYGVSQFPFLYIVDGAGKVAFYMEGFQEDSEARLKHEIDFRLTQ